MADFEVTCPHCNQSLDCPEELGGKSVECPACKRVIAIPKVAAISVPPVAVSVTAVPPRLPRTEYPQRKGGMAAPPERKVNSGTKTFKNICIVVFAIIFISFVAKSLVEQSGSNNSTHATISSQVAAASTSEAVTYEAVPLATLLSQYKDNEVRAGEYFKGKNIQITGIVESVKRDILNSIYITMGTGRNIEIPMAQCLFDEKQKSQVTSLRNGDIVTVRGRVSGLMFNVIIRECSIVP